MSENTREGQSWSSGKTTLLSWSSTTALWTCQEQTINFRDFTRRDGPVQSLKHLSQFSFPNTTIYQFYSTKSYMEPEPRFVEKRKKRLTLMEQKSPSSSSPCQSIPHSPWLSDLPGNNSIDPRDSCLSPSETHSYSEGSACLRKLTLLSTRLEFHGISGELNNSSD